jgi:Flp pilus assembly protein TadB
MADSDRARERRRARDREARAAERDRQDRAERGRERREGRGRRRAGPESDHLPLDRENLILFAVSLGIIVLGYLFLARGSITLAPILLVLGYCVLVPLAIIYRPRRRLAAEPEPPGRAAKQGGE